MYFQESFVEVNNKLLILIQFFLSKNTTPPHGRGMQVSTKPRHNPGCMLSRSKWPNLNNLPTTSRHSPPPPPLVCRQVCWMFYLGRGIEQVCKCQDILALCVCLHRSVQTLHSLFLRRELPSKFLQPIRISVSKIWDIGFYQLFKARICYSYIKSANRKLN